MKFSIIVPCFNLEPWIRECIDSVLTQTYNDWECIVIDDDSTDASGKTLDDYTIKDSRIKVIHQDNKGEGGARNSGLAVAKGDWVFFLDGDDVMASGALERLVDLIVAYPAVSLFRFGYEFFDDGKDWHPTVSKNEATYKDFSREILMSDFFTYATQHLYRRDVVRGVEFTHYKRGCDRVFVSEVLLARVDAIVISDQIFYGYRNRSSSAMNTVPSVRVLIDELQHRLDIVRMIERSKKHVPYAGHYWLEGYFTESFGKYVSQKTSSERKVLWNEWYACVKDMRGARGLSVKARIIYSLCTWCPCRLLWWLLCRAWPMYYYNGTVPRFLRRMRGIAVCRTAR